MQRHYSVELHSEGLPVIVTAVFHKVNWSVGVDLAPIAP